MITIVTPVLNGSKYIRENIESIKKLRIPFEHIIVDGGSTDGTLEILKEYHHLTILNQKQNTGMYGAIDMGFKIAKGDYVCWLNSDDEIISTGFEKLYDFAKNKKLDLVCANGMFYYVNLEKKKIIRGTRFVKYFLRKSFFPFVQPSSFFKIELYNKVKGFDYKNFKIAGDGDLYTRMALVNTTKFGYLNVTSSIFRLHGNSLGDLNKELWRKEVATKDYLYKVNLTDRILLKCFRLCHI